MNPNHIGFMFMLMFAIGTVLMFSLMLMRAVRTMHVDDFFLPIFVITAWSVNMLMVMFMVFSMFVIVLAVWSVLVISHVSPHRLASLDTIVSFSDRVHDLPNFAEAALLDDGHHRRRHHHRHADLRRESVA